MLDITPPQAGPPGALAIVATPIGNLRDITLRALDVLRAADLIAAEDTRTSQHLLAAHGIQARMLALHEHNETAAAARVVEALRAGQRVAYISDAGTPGISDPGARLVRAVRAAGLAVLPVPGPSALAAAVSVSGLEGPLLFAGFLPPKATARRKALENLRDLRAALVFYEAPHRIEETAADLAAVLGPCRELVIARELTKKFEQVHAGLLADATAWLAADDNRRRGEFVLVVGPPEASDGDGAAQAAEARRVLDALLEELPVKPAARLAARLTGARRNDLYDLAMSLKHASPARESPEEGAE